MKLLIATGLLVILAGCQQNKPKSALSNMNPDVPTQKAGPPPAQPQPPPPQNWNSQAQVPVAVSAPEQAQVDSAWVDMQIAQLQLQLALQKVLKNHKDLMYDGQSRKFYKQPQFTPTPAPPVQAAHPGGLKR